MTYLRTLPETIQAFAIAVSETDSVAIGNLLDTSISYRDLHKEVALKKFEALFEEIRFSTQEKLKIISAREGPLTPCNDFDGAVCFHAEEARQCIYFAFYKKGNGFVVQHAPLIFYADDLSNFCKSFQFEVYQSETIGFTAPLNFEENLRRCQDALDEISGMQVFPWPWADVVDWLHKYRNAIEGSMALYLMAKCTTEFAVIYEELQQLEDMYELSSEVFDAELEFKEIDSRSEDQLLTWLLKYEPLGNLMSVRADCLNIIDGETDSKYIIVGHKTMIKVNFDVFAPHYNFGKKFSPIYENMILKYRCKEACDEDEDFEDENWGIAVDLSDHLRAAGLL